MKNISNDKNEKEEKKIENLEKVKKLIKKLKTPLVEPIRDQKNLEAKRIELIEALDKKDLEEVKKLIKEGAGVNAKSKNGRTALMVAAEKGYLEIANYLESLEK
ncbi:MAG: ankyrin repeat domain-containing protein [Candidatus Micrarchaeota archaeon]|nr:ankyrin repeat domain-containing protein [Candidatus Micrarchaeota archaeon]